MKTSRRLFLAVLPAVFGVLTVAALAYWGEYAHSAPEIVVIIAAIAATGSLIIAWFNTRYVAQRIAQIAEKVGETAAELDDLDAIETVVDRHAAALKEAELRGSKAKASADARLREHGELMWQVAATVSRALDEIRLPLHILLENRFGDLNENQEEMLDAARNAAETANTDADRLAEIGQLDRGVLSLRKDRVHLADVVQSLRPTLESEGSRIGVSVGIEVEPALPALTGDRSRLQEALALLLADCVRRTQPGMSVRIRVAGGISGVTVGVDHGAPESLDVASALARRLLEAHGGVVARAHGRLSVMFSPPLASADSTDA
ncbi:MAG: sensor histidine kinase [Gemmatimonadaceae bacterium]